MPENTETNDMHQLHITIPKPLYEKIRAILPEHGGVTSLVRNLLIGFVRNFENSSLMEESVFDKTVGEAVNRTRTTHGGIDGT